MHTVLLDVDTTGRQVADLTEEVAAFCRDKGDGLVHVFAPHATAGVADNPRRHVRLSFLAG